MATNKDKDRYFRNTSFSLAAFLFSKGEQISGVNDVINSRDKEFVFIRTFELEELVNVYRFGEKNNPELLVNVRDYEEARRILMDRLNGR